jgi:transposase-like protein
MAKTTIASLSREIATEAEAYAYLENLRWRGQAVCAHCNGSDVYLITTKNGVSRATRTGAQSERRVWKCRQCGKQFSVLTGTIMHGTKISIRTWVLVYFDFMTSKNGMSAREVERKYGVCPRSAWFMMHRIREAMKDDGMLSTMRGTIVADETYIGGNPRKMNKSARGDLYKLRMTPWVGDKLHGATAKTPVLSLINAQTGEVRSRVVPKVDGSNLRKVISEHVDMSGSVLWTDEGGFYNQLGQEFISHATVNHSADEYKDWITGASTNKAESFFSQVKRSLDGTHHHISREHLPRYLAEFDYRYTTHKMSDAGRMADLIGRIDGKRLTYKLAKKG